MKNEKYDNYEESYGQLNIRCHFLLTVARPFVDSNDSNLLNNWDIVDITFVSTSSNIHTIQNISKVCPHKSKEG